MTSSILIPCDMLTRKQCNTCRYTSSSVLLPPPPHYWHQQPTRRQQREEYITRKKNQQKCKKAKHGNCYAYFACIFQATVSRGRVYITNCVTMHSKLPTRHIFLTQLPKIMLLDISAFWFEQQKATHIFLSDTTRLADEMGSSTCFMCSFFGSITSYLCISDKIIFKYSGKKYCWWQWQREEGTCIYVAVYIQWQFLHLNLTFWPSNISIKWIHFCYSL